MKINSKNQEKKLILISNENEGADFGSGEKTTEAICEIEDYLYFE